MLPIQTVHCYLSANYELIYIRPSFWLQTVIFNNNLSIFNEFLTNASSHFGIHDSSIVVLNHSNLCKTYSVRIALFWIPLQVQSMVSVLSSRSSCVVLFWRPIANDDENDSETLKELNKVHITTIKKKNKMD